MATADVYVAALPFDRLLDLVPAEIIDREPYFANLRRLEVSPITSVHLWFDRTVMDLPHAVLIDCLGQWVFNRGEVRPGEHYLQVVVSAAREVRGLGGEEIQRQIVEELRRLFPAWSAMRRHCCAAGWSRSTPPRSAPPCQVWINGVPGRGIAVAQSPDRRRLDGDRLAGHDGGSGPQRVSTRLEVILRPFRRMEGTVVQPDLA